MNEIISPLYLYPTGNSDENENIFSFLADKPTMQRFVSDLCNRLHHPVALIDYNTLKTANEPEKLESMVENYPMRRACSILRKCAGDDLCKKCDIFHARCMDLDILSINENIKQCMEKPLDYFYPGYSKNPPIVHKKFGRPVIEYNCPMLGYRELIFPLYYDGIIYGVVFAGQIMVYGDNDSYKNKGISKGFFDNKKPEELFGQFVEGFNKQVSKSKLLSSNEIMELITTSDEKAKKYDDILCFKPKDVQNADYYSKTFNTKQEYESFIRSVCREIKKTESNIAEVYDARRKKSLSETMGQITDKYFDVYERVHSKSYTNKHELRTAELKSAWEALQTFAQEIKNRFNLVEVIVLFGEGQSLKIEDSSEKRVVFSVSSNGVSNKSAVWDGTLDFSRNSIKGISDHDNSLAKPEILEGLSENLRKDNRILIRCHNIAMLIQVENLSKHKGVYKPLTIAIENELVRINSIIALCTANLLKEKYLLTLRMYRHENAHISTRLMGTINRYFANNGQRFLEEDEKKQESICNDMKNTVQLISNIADNIGFVTGSAIAKGDTHKELKNIDIVDMLYKWQIMFRDELKRRNLDIIIYRGGYDSSTIGYKMWDYLKRIANVITQNAENHEVAPREITVNSRLFELLVYNIVDNAVKYAYRGTNIYLIWSKLEDFYELSVTSYGPKMPKGKSMYGLYVRGTSEYNRILQGDGLGLFVVDRAAQLLGIDVSHDCQYISSYNVPLFQWYSNYDFSRVKDYTKIEDSKLIVENKLQADLVINSNPHTKITEDDLTSIYLRRRIELDTWRTTFRVRVPSKNK